MDDYFEFADQEHIGRERAKAREMKQSNWWKQRLGEGKCYHCEQLFKKEALTMDHLIPLARGGKTTKQNVVTSCRPCNASKKHYTRAELALKELEKLENPNDSEPVNDPSSSDKMQED